MSMQVMVREWATNYSNQMSKWGSLLSSGCCKLWRGEVSQSVKSGQSVIQAGTTWGSTQNIPY